MNTYKDYLQMPGTLKFDEMQSIHKHMIDEIGNDPEALEIYQELVSKATEYAAIRAGWPALSREEKLDMDPRRTSCHDSLIVKTNMLSRFLQRQGKPAAWRNVLGDEANDVYARKRIGDFGCYLTFINALIAR